MLFTLKGSWPGKLPLHLHVTRKWAAHMCLLGHSIARALTAVCLLPSSASLLPVNPTKTNYGEMTGTANASEHGLECLVVQGLKTPPTSALCVKMLLWSLHIIATHLPTLPRIFSVCLQGPQHITDRRIPVNIKSDGLTPACNHIGRSGGSGH